MALLFLRWHRFHGCAAVRPGLSMIAGSPRITRKAPSRWLSPGQLRLLHLLMEALSPEGRALGRLLILEAVNPLSGVGLVVQMALVVAGMVYVLGSLLGAALLGILIGGLLAPTPALMVDLMTQIVGWTSTAAAFRLLTLATGHVMVQALAGVHRAWPAIARPWCAVGGTLTRWQRAGLEALLHRHPQERERLDHEVVRAAVERIEVVPGAGRPRNRL